MQQLTSTAKMKSLRVYLTVVNCLRCASETGRKTNMIKSKTQVWLLWLIWLRLMATVSSDAEHVSWLIADVVGFSLLSSAQYGCGWTAADTGRMQRSI